MTTSPAVLPEASVIETLAVLTDLVLPTVAKGIIMRRPFVLGFAERLQLDARAIRRMQRVRNKYESDPLPLRIPGRSVALILTPEHVHRVLRESPEPFATATREKTAALAHFEPKGVLISRGAERTDRRRYNEEVLDAHQPVHRLSETFREIVMAEGSRLCRSLVDRADLTWDAFSDTWFRIVRRILFGDKASDDNEPSAIMAKLRSAANWVYFAPRRRRLLDRLLQQIDSYVARADPESLAGIMARTHATEMSAPSQQVPQWLFAFDAVGMTTFRTLALLASYRQYAREVRQEVETQRTSGKHGLPYTRAAILESLRLWPTSPLILRETTRETEWPNGVLPAKTELVIYTPFFHRDSERLLYADRFTPALWSNGEEQQEIGPLIPFSEGPAICPGRHLVLLLAPLMLSAILENARVRLKHPERLITEDGKLPGTLNHFKIRFELRSRKD